MAKKDDRGFWINAKGEAVHPELIGEDEKIKEQLIEGAIQAALKLSTMIKEFKDAIAGDLEAYFALLLERYNMNVRSRTKKGNFTLINYSSTMKIQIAVSETINFDEKLQLAKIQIDEFLNDITKDAPADIRTIINQAFEVDKESKISAAKIFGLKKYQIKDTRWLGAMGIIDDSIKVCSTKSYTRFYTRDNADSPWKAIVLDIAGV